MDAIKDIFWREGLNTEKDGLEKFNRGLRKYITDDRIGEYALATNVTAVPSLMGNARWYFITALHAANAI